MADRYAMYLRKSRSDDPNATIEQVLSKHRGMLNELADRLGITDIQHYEEVVSGESLYARPRMLELLEQVEAGTYKGVLCVDIDRLGRGAMSEQGIILEAFRISETLIITPGKTYDLSNDLDEEQTEIKALFARMELKMIRKRMRRGLMQTIEAGGYVANAPYGYRQCRVGKLPSLEIDENQARFIRHIYDRYLQGVGASTIAEELNAMGSVPLRNAQWSRSTVREVLRNPTYAGKVAWNRVKHYKPNKNNPKHHVVYQPEDSWLMADGLHPAIIPWDDWLRVQEIRKSKFIPSQNKGQVANPLAGLIVCGNCGFNMQRMGQNKGEARLLCNQKGCMPSSSFDRVEARLLADLEVIRDQLAIEVQRAVPVDTSTQEAILRATEASIRKNEQKIALLYDLLEDGTYTRETFRERLAKAESERQDLEQRRAAILEEIAAAKAADKTVMLDRIGNILDLYPLLDNEGKNLLLKGLISKVTYRKKPKAKPNEFTLEIELKAI